MEKSFVNYLIDIYGYNEPILLSEVRNRKDCTYSYNTLKQKFSRCVQRGELKRYEKRDGIYFAPQENALGLEPKISTSKLVNRMYICNDEEVFGYKTNLTFANMLNLTSQVPAVIEIATSKEKSRKRVVKINKMKLILRKPRVEVNAENYELLQILDLLSNFYRFSEKPLYEAKDNIFRYLNDVKITRELYYEILKNYPENVREKSWEIDLENVITY